MTRAKASDTVVIRKLIQARGPENLAAMLAKLSRTRDLFMAVTPSEWLELEQEAEILQAAAAVLYPQDPRPLRSLAHEVARINFSGIYRVFLQIATPAFIIKRISGIWHTFYEKGEARVETVGPNNYALIALNIPELPSIHREYNCGFITGVLELTNTKNVRVAFDGSNPNAWRWDIQWG